MPTLQYPSDVAFTSAVKAVQERKGSRSGYARMERGRGWRTRIDDDLRGFLAGLDMFYLATATAEGQPYIQYRGGPVGFLKVLDDRTLAFADFGGNRQYISVGNLSENPRAFLFLMDYVNAQRVKVWGTARVVEDDPELLRSLADAAYDADPQRAIVFTVEAWDINCPQHIHRRLPEQQVSIAIDRLQQRIRELEAQLAAASADRVALTPAESRA